MSPAPAVLAALASPRRQEILRLVWRQELSAGEIHRAMPDVTFGAISLQLRALADVGLLDTRAEHKFRYYKARREALGAMAQVLERMWDDALWRLKLTAELEQSRRGPRPLGRAKPRSPARAKSKSRRPPGKRKRR